MFEAWAQWRMWNHCHNHYTVNQKQKTNVDRDKTLQFVFPKAQNAVFFSRGLRCSHHWNFEIIVTIITHSIWGIPTTNKVRSISRSTNPTKKTPEILYCYRNHTFCLSKRAGRPQFFSSRVWGIPTTNKQQGAVNITLSTNSTNKKPAIVECYSIHTICLSQRAERPQFFFSSRVWSIPTTNTFQLATGRPRHRSKPPWFYGLSRFLLCLFICVLFIVVCLLCFVDLRGAHWLVSCIDLYCVSLIYVLCCVAVVTGRDRLFWVVLMCLAFRWFVCCSLWCVVLRGFAWCSLIYEFHWVVLCFVDLCVALCCRRHGSWSILCCRLLPSWRVVIDSRASRASTVSRASRAS